MHEPMKIKDLKELLKGMEDDKEVVVLLGNNYYDITATEKENHGLTLFTTSCFKRDLEDN